MIGYKGGCCDVYVKVVFQDLYDGEVGSYQSGLCIFGQCEVFDGVIGYQIGQVLVQGCIDFVKDGFGIGEVVGKFLVYIYGLGVLIGKNKGEFYLNFFF